MSPIRLVWTVADCVLVAATVFQWALVMRMHRSGFLNSALGLLLGGTAYLIFVVGLLGEFKILNAAYISLTLVCGCATTLLVAKRRLSRGDVSSFVEETRRWMRLYGPWSSVTRALVLALVLAVVLLGVTAVLSVPLVVDDLAYRLPRIGYWIQQQSTESFPTFNERMNYMPRGGELIQLWLVAHFSTGYPACAIVGWLGAVLLALSTIAWGRSLKLGLPISVVAGLLVLATPVVVSQSTTAQTDLLAAGLFHAGLYFFWRSLKCDCWSVLPAIGFAAGLATKGTIWFALPGTIILGGGIMLLYKPRLSVISMHALAVSLAVVLLCGPSWLANIARYGNMFGPTSEVVRFREGSDKVGLVEKIKFNAAAWALQNLEPAANVPVAAEPIGRWGVSLAHRILRAEPKGGSLVAATRLIFLKGELATSQVRMETLSFGILPGVLFCLGCLAPIFLAIRRRHLSIGLYFSIWLASIAGAFLVQVAWQPFAFRFFVIVLPIAWLLALDVLRIFTKKYYFPAAIVCLCAEAIVAANVYCNDIRSGFVALTDYANNSVHRLTEDERAFVEHIPGSFHTLTIALNDHPNQPGVAGFLRTDAPIAVKFASRAAVQHSRFATFCLDLLGADVLIVPSGTLYIRPEDKDIWRIDAQCLRSLHAECFVKISPEEAAKFVN